MKKIIILTAVLLLFTAALFLSQKEQVSSNDKMKITVTTFALYDIVKHVGGRHVDAEMVIPFGVEVHSFEPTPKTIMEIQKSRLFLYSGAALEPWVIKLTQNNNMQDMSQYVYLREADETSEESVEHEEHEAHHHHEHGAMDPHYWLDIANMKLLTRQIALALVKIDSEHEAYYLESATRYLDTLAALDEAYQKRLSSCRVREVVLHHNILGYVAEKYDFAVSSLTGLSPDSLADAKTMAKLSSTIKQKGIKVLFFEAFVSDRLMQNLARENGIELDYLEPLANITAQQAEAGMDYVEGMQINLDKLSNAMECE